MTRAPGRRGNFLRFLRYVAPYKGFLILATVGGIVKFTVPLLVPELTRYLVDDVFLNEDLVPRQKTVRLLASTGGLAAVFVLFWTPLTYMRHYYAGLAGQRSVFDLRCDLYYRILRMSSSFFSRNKSGGIVSRLMGDVEIVQNLVGTAMTNVWMDLVSLLLILYLLLRIDPVLTLVALVTFPLYLFFFRRFGREIRSTAGRVQEGMAMISGNVQERIAGSTLVRAFGQEKREERTFVHDARLLLSNTLRSTHLQSANVAITGILTQIAPLIVIVYGGWTVIHGDLSVGELIAVTLYLGPLYLPLQRFSELNVVFANATAALDRVFEILDEEPEVRNAPDAVELARVRGRVEFARVSFSYDAKAVAPVLREVSFIAEPGHKIALVGQSGSGKSTVIGLIPRFYDVTEGAVTIDGIDVRSVTLSSLRQQIGMVLQSPILFTGTVRENILYGKPRATADEVTAACEAAGVLAFVRALPRGLDTEVGEGGGMLSGGQRQRITIARAFLKDPRILILDEATSALDTESERLIGSALERLMGGRTTFVIAHRLSTVVGADRILVMAAGRIVESGTHEELLRHDGVYRGLYERVYA